MLICVGGTKTSVFGMLINVHTTIGIDPVHATDIVYTIFCILHASRYHVIPGYQLLTSLYALIDIQSGYLTMTTSSGHTKIIPTMHGRQVEFNPSY